MFCRFMFVHLFTYAYYFVCSIVVPEKIQDLAPLNQIKVLAFRDKEEWTLESKYNIGRKKTAEE